MEHVDFAVQQLKANGYSCVAYNGKQLLESKRRGVAPLLQWLEEKQELSGYGIADKVVGKGAAFLYVLLGATRLHAFVISQPALDVLLQHGVEVSYDTCVPAIRNRDNTGYCPIESVVLDCNEPEIALIQINKKIKELTL